MKKALDLVDTSKGMAESKLEKLWPDPLPNVCVCVSLSLYIYICVCVYKLTDSRTEGPKTICPHVPDLSILWHKNIGICKKSDRKVNLCLCMATYD